MADIEVPFGISTLSAWGVAIISVLFGTSLVRIIESVAPLSMIGFLDLRFVLLGGVLGVAEFRELFILLLHTSLLDFVASLAFVPTPPRQARRYPGVTAEFPSFPLILIGRVALVCSAV